MTGPGRERVEPGFRLPCPRGEPGLGIAAEYALVSLPALNGLRVSEAGAIGSCAGIRPSVKPGDETPKAYALEHIQSRIDAIAKAQADGLVSRRFDASVLFALIIHTAALWEQAAPMSFRRSTSLTPANAATSSDPQYPPLSPSKGIGHTDRRTRPASRDQPARARGNRNRFKRLELPSPGPPTHILLPAQLAIRPTWKAPPPFLRRAWVVGGRTVWCRAVRP